MDAATPPSIVFESAAQCADRDRAEEVFRQILGGARAPGPGWVVTMRIGARPSPAVSAEADVADPTGTARAHNVLAGEATDCTALARSMGDWATVVLQTVQNEGVGGAALPALPAQETRAPNAIAPPVSTTVAPAPVARPDATLSEAKPEYEAPTLELGVGAFFLVGGAAGAYFGVSPFLIDELAEGVFLRPSLAVGGSLGTGATSTWAAGRLDACLRLPGRYGSRNGIQLDLCGGADAGFSYVPSGAERGAPSSATTLPYVDIGPSGDLRGEVGDLAIFLRGLVGINVARSGFVDVTGAPVDAPGASWRLEIDFSWALRHSP